MSMEQQSFDAPTKLIDIQELADKTGMPASWLRNATKEGSIPGLRVGVHVRYNLPAVQRALAKMAEAPAQPLGKADIRARAPRKGPAIVQASTGA